MYNYKVAVITANFGNYDTIKEPINIKNIELFDWYYFTDNKDIKSDVYKVINESHHIPGKPVLCAKYYKIQHHKIDFIQKYDYIVWHDSSFYIQNVNFVNDILELLKGDPKFVLYKHPQRTTITQEVSVLNRMRKFSGQNFNAQLSKYTNDGFTDNKGLYSLGFFIRKINSDINKLFDDWFYEITTCTVRDQVSFPYILWRHDVTPNIVIQDNINNNKLIGKLGNHK